MPVSIPAKPLTIRLQPELYSAAERLAQRRAISINGLVQQSLAAAIRADEERERYDAYTLLGSDPEECDVEYAIHAQAEVMLNDDI